VNRVQNLSGQALPRAPDVAFNLGADYIIKAMLGWFADFSIKGNQYVGSFNRPREVILEATYHF
jgi:hypothetical protein